MRKPIEEIQNVLRKHNYSINNIIFEVMKTFKLKSLCCRVGFQKQDGYSASEIITLMLVLPLMLLKSVNALYKSEFQKVTAMKKDSIYRLKNNEKMPWRSLLWAVAKQFQRLVNPEKEIAGLQLSSWMIQRKQKPADGLSKSPLFMTMLQEKWATN